MKASLLLLAAVSCFVAGHRALGPREAEMALRTTVPLSLDQLTLDRAFRCHVTVSPQQPVILQAPASGGGAITQLRIGSLSGGIPASVVIDVNGMAEEFNFTAIPIDAQRVYDLKPPIVVRPNDVVTISIPGFYNGGSAAQIALAGYRLNPGEA